MFGAQCRWSKSLLISTWCNGHSRWMSSVAIYCNSLQLTATHCNSLQLTATHCNKATVDGCQVLQVKSKIDLKISVAAAEKSCQKWLRPGSHGGGNLDLNCMPKDMHDSMSYIWKKKTLSHASCTLSSPFPCPPSPYTQRRAKSEAPTRIMHDSSRGLRFWGPN